MDIISLMLGLVLAQTPEPGTVFEPTPVVQYDDVEPTQPTEELETGGACWDDNTCEPNEDGEVITSDANAVIPGSASVTPDEFPEGFLDGTEVE